LERRKAFLPGGWIFLSTRGRILISANAAYDNYRDDHEYFRRLTQSAGVLRWNGRELEVHLLPATPHGAVLRRVWEQVLSGVNATQPVWSEGAGGGWCFGWPRVRSCKSV
jgi:hypothetical protein